MARQLLSTWLALRCREEAFQRFLRVPTEDLAVRSVRAICGVKSRSEIDNNQAAEKRFHQFIRLPYAEFLESEERTHAHHHD
jgi:hypothetical protein